MLNPKNAVVSNKAEFSLTASALNHVRRLIDEVKILKENAYCRLGPILPPEYLKQPFSEPLPDELSSLPSFFQELRAALLDMETHIEQLESMINQLDL